MKFQFSQLSLWNINITCQILSLVITLNKFSLPGIVADNESGRLEGNYRFQNKFCNIYHQFHSFWFSSPCLPFGSFVLSPLSSLRFGVAGDAFPFGVSSSLVIVLKVHDDVYVGASSNDKKDEKHYRPTPKKKDDQPTPIKIQKRKCRESFMRALEDQKYLIKELKRRVVVLEAQLAEEKARRRNKDDGGQSMPRAEPSMNSGFVFPSGMYTNESPMKTYVRVGSQRRYKGRVLRTLYTRNGVLRIKNE
ncbi:uncharacterized protein LOC128197726 isoform X4 [Vigna angularis]|uniref:uncharacterized protein LOC128197726 isoform X4 n=1 Tax=Phaseolus angularis TaxID=3914 RepID=UPI0022B3102B|nr:uncharacterized protein LOC128197726 isoform X4 [Vigna angularis]